MSPPATPRSLSADPLVSLSLLSVFCVFLCFICSRSIERVINHCVAYSMNDSYDEVGLRCQGSQLYPGRGRWCLEGAWPGQRPRLQVLSNRSGQIKEIYIFLTDIHFYYCKAHKPALSLPSHFPISFAKQTTSSLSFPYYSPTHHHSIIHITIRLPPQRIANDEKLPVKTTDDERTTTNHTHSSRKDRLHTLPQPNSQ